MGSAGEITSNAMMSRHAFDGVGDLPGRRRSSKVLESLPYGQVHFQNALLLENMHNLVARTPGPVFPVRLALGPPAPQYHYQFLSPSLTSRSDISHAIRPRWIGSCMRKTPS